MVDSILRLPIVTARTGLSRATIYLKIKQKRFPQQVALGGRAVGWWESEVNSWLDSLERVKEDPLRGVKK
ncbi:MAG: AlpA family transcriptional regulator [endosymbiont of Galathealinum brachiosum]|uniref:AlpA family transcriptional regulator n=1 Tax=endosymbiont of Galathealinum brachiosum TaxID=2200906 RepID=A0A370DCQ6_9GAMM|nr:MAG: AlpA family transcriptional regulator [endosymbiont of Galathealinum brachiosum]